MECQSQKIKLKGRNGKKWYKEMYNEVGKVFEKETKETGSQKRHKRDRVM